MSLLNSMISAAVSNAAKAASSAAASKNSGSKTSSGSGGSKSSSGGSSYYDPNKDYSKELQRTDLSSSERAQLQQERQNKIDSKYGGVEPNMTGSNKTYSQIYGGSSNMGGSLSGGGVYGTVDTVNGRPDMGRRRDLAGRSVKVGQYTVTYDADGYAVRTVPDYGASATSTLKTTHANDSQLHQAAYQAAQQGDWDKVGYYTNLIAMEGGVNEDGTFDMTEANQYLRELSNEFKYNPNDYYNALYDQAYGRGSAAVFDATGGAIKTYDQLAAAIGQEAAQQFVANQSGGTAGTTSAALAGVTGLTGGINGTNSQYSANGGYTGVQIDDMTQYINDMYEQNLAAEIAALKSAYDSNVAEMESQNDKIAEQYRSARNQVAGQNELQRQQFNEYALAQGLNTGTAGQGALAQSMAYQGNLGNLYAQEASDQADIDLALSQLLNQYNSSVQQTTAQINAQKSQALYEELIRQQELAAQNQAIAREYAMGLLSNGVMPDSATLAEAGISSTEASSLYGLASGAGTVQEPTLTASQTLNALKNGVVNDTTLAAYEYYFGEPYGGGTTSAATATNPTATPTPKKAGGGYDNGGLSNDKVAQVQRFIGVTADGLWGKQSSGAVNGATAQQAWNAYQAAQSVKDYASASAALRNGGASGANIMTSMEFIRHKNSGNSDYAAYASYQDYLRDAVFAALV